MYNTDSDRCDFLVDRLDILGESVHELTERCLIEESELGVGDLLDQSLMHSSRRRKRTAKQKTFAEECNEHEDEAEDGVDDKEVCRIDTRVVRAAESCLHR